LCQVVGAGIRILCDWIKEGDPGSTLRDILTEAKLFTGDRFSVFAGPQHWNTYDTIGLQAAARQAMVRLKTGGNEAAGREELRKRIDQIAHAAPALQVSTKAKWTLNGFSGGYARSVVKGGAITEMADEGVYRVLMEGLECFVAATAGALGRDGEDAPNYAIDAQGRRYLSARATHGR
jgi:hypothetical protein